MIRIRKPEAPGVLTSRGAAETRRLCDEFDQHGEQIVSGQRRFDFEGSIYAHPDVKQTLIDAQRGKCAFCESKVTHVDYGDVEHYRPKAAVRQVAGGPLRRPGYYWLAYDWNNLFLACSQCNQRFKENLFPLDDPTARVSYHGDAARLAREKPMLIHPADDYPARYITFHEEIAVPLQNRRRGRATIEALGLNREPLLEQRRKKLGQLKRLKEIVRLGQERDGQMAEQMVRVATKAIDELLAPDGQYLRMSRVALRHR
jgi:uncharacterized protein (TIGR02646 family)